MFKTWFYLTKLGWIPFLAAIGVLFLWPRPLPGGLIFGLFLPIVMLCLCGAVFGLLMAMDRLRWKCPFCKRKSSVGGDKTHGLWMECDSCGFICGGGRFGTSLVREASDETSADETRSQE
jgi:ribosomal protein L37AE/L43A